MHDDVYDDVVARVVAQVEAVDVGDPFDPTVLMGPVVSAAACERILGVIARAVDEGAGTLLTGGRRLDREGYFIAPTVFGEVDHDSSLAREEIFGPVLSVLRFRDEEEVVAKANDSDFGLSAYVVKSSLNDPRITLGDIFRGTGPFTLIMVGVLLLLMAFPSLSLVLLK